MERESASIAGDDPWTAYMYALTISVDKTEYAVCVCKLLFGIRYTPIMPCVNTNARIYPEVSGKHPSLNLGMSHKKMTLNVVLGQITQLYFWCQCIFVLRKSHTQMSNVKVDLLRNKAMSMNENIFVNSIIFEWCVSLSYPNETKWTAQTVNLMQANGSDKIQKIQKLSNVSIHTYETFQEFETYVGFIGGISNVCSRNICRQRVGEERVMNDSRYTKPTTDKWWPVSSSLLPNVSLRSRSSSDDNLSGKDGVDFLAIASSYKSSMVWVSQ